MLVVLLQKKGKKRFDEYIELLNKSEKGCKLACCPLHKPLLK